MYRVVFNGVDILKKSNNTSWNSDTDTLGMQVTFDSLVNLTEGSIISFLISSKEYFRGIIIKKSEGKFSYNYTAMDYSFYFKNEVIKQFNGIKASSAITSLLKEYGINSKIVNIPTAINKIYKQSLSDIIEDILKQAEEDQGIKYFKEMNVNTLVVKKLQDMRIKPKIIIGSDITIESSIEEMKNKILVVSSEESNNSIYAMAEDKNSINKFGLLQKIESIEEKNISQAKNITNNLLRQYNKVFKSTSINVLGIDGAETIRANRLIELNVGNKLKGWYKIKSANHTLSNNKHNVTIELEW